MDANFFQQMREMQRRAEELQKGLAAIEVEGLAGGGLVRIRINGLGELKKAAIDPSLMKPEEREILEDLVVAAFADARTKLESRRLADSQFIQDLLKSFGGLPGSG